MLLHGDLVKYNVHHIYDNRYPVRMRSERGMVTLKTSVCHSFFIELSEIPFKHMIQYIVVVKLVTTITVHLASVNSGGLTFDENK